MIILRNFLYIVSVFYVIYLVVYAVYSFTAVALGAYKMYVGDRMLRLRNRFLHDDMPISIIVPAYNESVTIVSSVKSLLSLDYQQFEIIVVDDGSKDDTAEQLIVEFGLKQINRPINRMLLCQKERTVYESTDHGAKITLICKENGGKGDALNMGINACRFPYFICMDADSKLQKDSLKEIVQPVFEDDSIVAVGGMVIISQCVRMKSGRATDYSLPRSIMVCLQAVEYVRSFMASRILMDEFNGNLIISGAFGLFKKSTVVAAGGYNPDNLGEDMELVMKLHGFCRNNNIKYRMRYQPRALCMTQAPTRFSDLRGQRRRWHLGLFQSMHTHRRFMFNRRFGLISFFSYLYYLAYELLAPFIEIFGVFTILLAMHFGLLHTGYMIMFFALYAVFGGVLSLAAFSQHIYTQRLRISAWDMLKALLLCILEFGFFRYVLVVVRSMAFMRYGKKRAVWGEIKRV